MAWSSGERGRRVLPHSGSMCIPMDIRTPAVDSQPLAQDVTQLQQPAEGTGKRKLLNDKTLGNDCHQESDVVTVHPEGFESEDATL